MDPAMGLIIGFLALAGVVYMLAGGTNNQLGPLVKAGHQVIDVRSEEEFREEHVKGALNIPVDQVGVRVSELGPPAKIIVYCRSGMRSRRAAQILRAAGFDVIDAGRLTAFHPDLRE